MKSLLDIQDHKQRRGSSEAQFIKLIISGKMPLIGNYFQTVIVKDPVYVLQAHNL